MKKILSILFISVILFSCSDGDKRYHIDEVAIPNDTLAYLKSDMSLLNNGVVYCEFGELGKFINGEGKGRHKRWYENGQLRYEGNYKDGKKDGVHKGWRENGQLLYEKNYIDGKEDGVHKGWWENGQLFYEANYKDGKEDGVSKA